jgi:hypothetical protein
MTLPSPVLPPTFVRAKVLMMWLLLRSRLQRLSLPPLSLPTSVRLVVLTTSLSLVQRQTSVKLVVLTTWSSQALRQTSAKAVVPTT